MAVRRASSTWAASSSPTPQFARLEHTHVGERCADLARIPHDEARMVAHERTTVSPT